MAAPRKFATLTADALRRSVTPEMERAAEVQLREVVRRVWWVLQPYRSFGESRVTIRRTEDTMKYIRGLPADSTQRATATALRARDAAQTAWRAHDNETARSGAPFSSAPKSTRVGGLPIWLLGSAFVGLLFVPNPSLPLRSWPQHHASPSLVAAHPK